MWTKIKRWWAAFLIAFLGIGTVVSQTATDQVTWIAPTTRVDGTPLPASQIQNYKVYAGTTPGGPKTVVATVTGLTTTINRGANPIGTRCYYVTTVDTANLESSPSNEACKTVFAVPSSPTGLTVN